MIAIVDYGVGNLSSIKNMIKKAGGEAIITADQNEIDRAEKIIIPGVGHFDHCMKQFNASGLRDDISKKVFDQKTPVLGVCVGCQMLMESSEEGNEPGLGWIKGKVIKFKKENLPSDHKIPHMGWADVQPVDGATLYNEISEPRFYFVHSYHVLTDPSNITATASYGYTFTASVGAGNIQGVQFHPEKSHKFGMKLYSNFIKGFS